MLGVGAAILLSILKVSQIKIDYKNQGYRSSDLWVEGLRIAATSWLMVSLVGKDSAECRAGPCVPMPAASRLTGKSPKNAQRILGRRAASNHQPPRQANSPTHPVTEHHPVGRKEGGRLTLPSRTGSPNMAVTTAAAATAAQYISLAKTLPAKLQRFLARYPPPQFAAPQTGYQTDTTNPFFPHRHEASGNLHDPVFSARRQADLVKLARDHGVEELLPHGRKRTEVRLAYKVRLGWRGKGTGIGQKVKGHKHERQLEPKYVLTAGRGWDWGGKQAVCAGRVLTF